MVRLAKSGKMLADTVTNSMAPEVDKAAKHKGNRAHDNHLKKTGNAILKLNRKFLDLNKKVDKAWDNINKPSWWAGRIASLAEGKSIKASLTRDFDKELSKMRLRYQKLHGISLAHTSKNKKWVDDQAKLYRGLAKESRQQAKAYEKNLASYQRL